MTRTGEDFYKLQFVRQYLEVPVPAWTYVHMRVFSMMGDRAAISIMKIVCPARSIDDFKLKKILDALTAAFEFPESIEDQSDRIPAATSVLLGLLMSMSASNEQREQIRSTMNKIDMVQPKAPIDDSASTSR